MDMFTNLSATLSVEEVKKLISDAAEAQVGRPVADVVFNIVTRSIGYGVQERDEQVFTGVTIVFGPPPKPERYERGF